MTNMKAMSGKWEIDILDNNIVEYRDSKKWRTTYYEFRAIPAGILFNKDSRYYLDKIDVPETALRKAKSMIKKT